MILDFPFSIGTLSDGINGTPLQVINCEPNNETVGGGTPLRVHSLPKAATVSGCNKKKPGSFHTFESSSSRSSGVGAPLRVLTRCEAVTLFSNPYSPLLMSSLSC